jgi:hypothetical protein
VGVARVLLEIRSFPARTTQRRTRLSCFERSVQRSVAPRFLARTIDSGTPSQTSARATPELQTPSALRPPISVGPRKKAWFRAIIAKNICSKASSRFSKRVNNKSVWTTIDSPVLPTAGSIRISPNKEAPGLQFCNSRASEALWPVCVGRRDEWILVTAPIRYTSA